MPNDNRSRLIGQLQAHDNVINDFSVCARLSGEGIAGDEDDRADFDYLGIQLTECLKIQPAKDAIEKMSKEKTFEICLTWYGEGSVAQAFEIWHNYSD